MTAFDDHDNGLIPDYVSPDTLAADAAAWRTADRLRAVTCVFRVPVRVVVSIVRRVVRTFHSARQATGDGDGAAVALRALVSTLSRPVSLQGSGRFAFSAMCS